MYLFLQADKQKVIGRRDAGVFVRSVRRHGLQSRLPAIAHEVCHYISSSAHSFRSHSICQAPASPASACGWGGLFQYSSYDGLQIADYSQVINVACACFVPFFPSAVVLERQV